MTLKRAFIEMSSLLSGSIPPNARPRMEFAFTTRVKLKHKTKELLK